MSRTEFTAEQRDELIKIGKETGKETNQPIEAKIDTFLDELDIIHDIDRRVQDVDEAFDLAQEEEKEKREETDKFRKLQKMTLNGLKSGQESVKEGLGSLGTTFGAKLKGGSKSSFDRVKSFLTSPVGIGLGIFLGILVKKKIIDPISAKVKEFEQKTAQQILDLKMALNNIPFVDIPMTATEEISVLEKGRNKLIANQAELKGQANAIESAMTPEQLKREESFRQTGMYIPEYEALRLREDMNISPQIRKIDEKIDALKKTVENAENPTVVNVVNEVSSNAEESSENNSQINNL
tara:strand:+ start:1118 stop:2002 length:885 start_codon:yes stop_codon:yes gene_type:complete